MQEATEISKKRYGWKIALGVLAGLIAVGAVAGCGSKDDATSSAAGPVAAAASDDVDSTTGELIDWWGDHESTFMAVPERLTSVAASAGDYDVARTLSGCDDGIGEAESLLDAVDEMPSGEVKTLVERAANLTLRSFEQCADGDFEASTATLDEVTPAWEDAAAAVEALL
jgi:hypothetical protein